MLKALRNILIILLYFTFTGEKQIFGQSTSFEIIEFNDDAYINDSKADNVWRIENDWTGTSLKKSKKSNWRSIPFFGSVVLDEKNQITTIQIEDVLGTYGTFEGKLSFPISLSNPQSRPQVTSYIIQLEVDELPATMLSQLPIRPDSLRMRVEATYTDSEVGKTTVVRKDQALPAEYFERNFDISSIVEVKIGPFEWESIEDIAPMIDWNEDYVLQHILVYTNQYKLPTIMIEKRANRCSVAYASLNSNNGDLRPSGVPSIRAIPNPAINDLRFQLENLQPGVYTINIKNILGVLLASETIDYTQNQVLKIEVSEFRKGSYFYSLEDSNGNVISTKRLIILRP